MDSSFQGSRGLSLHHHHRTPSYTQVEAMAQDDDSSKDVLCEWFDLLQDFCCDLPAFLLAPRLTPSVEEAAPLMEASSVNTRSVFSNSKYDKETTHPQGLLPHNRASSYMYSSFSMSDSEDDDDDDRVTILRSWEHSIDILDDSVEETPLHTFRSRQQGMCPLGHQEVIMFK